MGGGRSGLLFLGLLAVSVGTAAHAQNRLGMDDRLATVDGWVVGINEAAASCLTSATFNDETTVWVGYGIRDQSFYFALTNPNWDSIEPGKQYDLRIEAVGGGRWQGKFTGVAREKDKGIISGSLKESFVNDLVKSAGIAVSVGRRTVAKLSLKGSSSAVSALADCQKVRTSAGTGGTPERKGGSTGTGFFVTTEGHILTNEHVVNGCSKLQVQRPGGLRYDARLLAKDAQNDLGLLLVTGMKPPAVAPLRSDIKLGESVSVFGFPLTDILASTGNFTVGHVTALAGMRDDTNQVQISAQVHPGNSGGPVLDRNANVIAVVVAILDPVKLVQARNIVPQNVNFAIKASTAAIFLDANGVKPSADRQTTALDTADIADRAKDFTVKVYCDGSK